MSTTTLMSSPGTNARRSSRSEHETTPGWHGHQHGTASASTRTLSCTHTVHPVTPARHTSALARSVYTHGKITYTRSGRVRCSHKGIGKGSSYSISERRVPELIPVLDSQPAGDVSQKPDGKLPLLLLLLLLLCNSCIWYNNRQDRETNRQTHRK